LLRRTRSTRCTLPFAPPHRSPATAVTTATAVTAATARTATAAAARVKDVQHRGGGEKVVGDFEENSAPRSTVLGADVAAAL
jgi:hypothetical protein